MFITVPHLLLIYLVMLRSTEASQSAVSYATRQILDGSTFKWKEAQRRHYLRMNTKKSPRLWTIGILQKLLMIRWDMWQFRNQVLHSPTGPTSIASHHSLNHQISKEKHRGTDGINQSNCHLFSTHIQLLNFNLVVSMTRSSV